MSDIYVNAVGGVRLSEPAADLAVVLAIASSAMEKSPPPETVVFGEVGLGGEVRRVRRLEQRLQEARQLGLKTVILPASQAKVVPSEGLELIGVEHIGEALQQLDEPSRPLARAPT